MADSAAVPDATRWPTMTQESRPWTRWWWFGSAVNEAEITRHLESLRAAGFGGVEISPIYGVTGAEQRYVPFLSPRWIELLGHTLREARRLDLGVDMITGSGWPLGGPWVGAEDAACRVLFEIYRVAGGGQRDEPLTSEAEPTAPLRVVMGYSQDGQVVDLSQYVDTQQRLRWTAPEGEWRLVALFQAATGQQVKRAAPGGEGHVVDHFSAGAIGRYLAYFDQPLAALAPTERVRCFFNDSYEVYGANWTDEFMAAFLARRGYDLRHYLLAWCGQAAPELVGRVRSDYRQTVADMLLENFVRPWTAWAHRQHARSRNQAHGSPGNLLDLYAAADIPETETFGTDWLDLAGLAPLPRTPRRYGGRAEIIAGKLASSAAHVTGKALCSSESFTWLGEHGRVTLDQMKAEVDVALVMGINHLFFHGTPFSPADAEWPGWLFYASTHVGPTNAWWRDLPALNHYISRCQSFLQAGQPDNELLVYWPSFDLWALDTGTQDLLHPLTPHNTEDWLDHNLPTFTATARRLWDEGYSYDLVSDQLLTEVVDVSQGQLRSRGGNHAALLVSGCTRMPPETLERILHLARAGATILVLGQLPGDVPGLGQLVERRQRLQRLVSGLGVPQSLPSGSAEVRIGQGRLILGPDLASLLQAADLRRESVVDTGIEVVRRRDETGYLYFMTNLGCQRVDQWISLAVQAKAVVILDPASDRDGLAAIRAGHDGHTQIYLQLEPGESCLLHTYTIAPEAPPWRYFSPAGQPQPIEGQWRVEFVAGGPSLPGPRQIGQLASWTEWPEDRAELEAFAGTACYSITFEKPDVEADAWLLDLGTVCHSARVKLNGQDLGAVWARPFRVMLPYGLADGENRLDIEVTNLMANRLAGLDRRGVAWHRFFFVNIAYQPFEASDWEPLPSGLLGSVQLVPMGRSRPPSAVPG